MSDGGSPQNPEQGADFDPVADRAHALYAVYGGLVALVVLNGISIIAFRNNGTNAVAAIGAISSPIVAMVSAYFGIKVGAQTGTTNAATADQARTKAENETKAVLGMLPPTDAVPIMQMLGLPTPSASDTDT